ncbi:MAG: CBS domain-containing protein [Chromatiales bacterium]|nr:CBS domain-containing protein [Gammaproteobacteria bacterium]MCP5230960.1 CBS domain-containing protein [Zoogloeaceae bacterium]MCP5351579.1 CBS domain-containing protein [Chromatiales bacterium]
MSHPRISVRDVMKPDVDMVDGMTTVADALINMKHTDSKCLIVKKRDDNDEYGIVTLSDIAKKVLAVDRAPERVNIYEIMTKPVIDVDPNMDIRYCARLFGRFALNRAPVIENGKVVGIISHSDMVIRGWKAYLDSKAG